ncbi:MAG: response regulator [bacterium]|nr:response regulator [bacterium]
MTRLLLLDDEPSILKALKRTIKIPDCTVDIFERPEDAVAALDTHSYSLIVSDYRMPRMDGVSFLKIARERQPEAIRIILSGYTDVGGLLAAINEAEIYRFIPKPWDDIDLVMTLRKTLEYAELLKTNHRLLAQVNEQQKIIMRQKMELQRLEEESPGITHVNRSDDGYIIIDDIDHEM